MKNKDEKSISFTKMYKAYSDNLQKSKRKPKKLINSPHKRQSMVK